MITIKTEQEIEYMRQAGAVVRDVLAIVEEHAKPGITTRKLNTIAYEYIKKCNASPSFLGYGGFPGAICTSIDEEVVHGIPSHRVLEEGTLLKVDAGAIVGGFHADAARTIAIGEIDSLRQNLMDVCKQSFFEGVGILKAGVRLGDLGHAIQSYVERNGFSIIKQLAGHGVGRNLHEDPDVLNYGVQGRGLRLEKNMVIAIEPMISAGNHRIKVLEDDWTVVTKDGSLSAHYENTVVIGDEGIEILTL
ncbi:MAG TPA: type I methionyl aminopeptidase [Clostridia bacterium]|jgi:methionyl aminopeptidase|nr:type I methionyl aminopeptidase [Clostridia bacterium]